MRISAENVYQEGVEANRRLVHKIVAELLLPGSGVCRFERLLELYEQAKRGKSCLILMEHFSNFDIPCLFYLLEQQGEKGKELAEHIIPMAGFKLNEESDVVRGFTEAYTRIVIYPSRSLVGISDPAKLEQEKRRAKLINTRAIQEMIRRKHQGHIILVFPAGTRYRPWEPSSKRGVKEVDSYIKSFDYMVPVSVNGNVLRVNPNGEMKEDLVAEDVVILTAGDLVNCRTFRDFHRAHAPVNVDLRQHVVDRVMDILSDLHTESEAVRLKRLERMAG